MVNYFVAMRMKPGEKTHLWETDKGGAIGKVAIEELGSGRRESDAQKREEGRSHACTQLLVAGCLCVHWFLRDALAVMTTYTRSAKCASETR